nr:uncharacterized protein LOC123757237 [Procambarus clarkii]
MNYHIPTRTRCHNHNPRSPTSAKTTPKKPAHIQHHHKTDSGATHHHRAPKPLQPHPRASKSLHQAPKTSKSPHLRAPTTTHRPWLSLKPRAMFHKLRSPTESSGIAYITPRREEFTKKGSGMSTSTSCSPVGSSGSSGSSSSSSSALLSSGRLHHQELHDLLSCPVCLEEYQTEKQGGREPLFLACHHSVCRVCLPKLIKVHPSKTDRINSKDVGELSCPECRLVTLVPPSGLSQNFYLVSLIESGRKKAKGVSSRLRMWCRECDTVALETCAGHHLTHLTAVLATSLTTYTTTCARVTTLLQVRARKNGEEVQEVKEALEQLDRASTSLRRRLVAHLDHATLAQATANSLLHEVEDMNRQVEYDGKLTDQPRLPCHQHQELG